MRLRGDSRRSVPRPLPGPALADAAWSASRRAWWPVCRGSRTRGYIGRPGGAAVGGPVSAAAATPWLRDALRLVRSCQRRSTLPGRSHTRSSGRGPRPSRVGMPPHQALVCSRARSGSACLWPAAVSPPSLSGSQCTVTGLLRQGHAPSGGGTAPGLARAVGLDVSAMVPSACAPQPMGRAWRMHGPTGATVAGCGGTASSGARRSGARSRRSLGAPPCTRSSTTPSGTPVCAAARGPVSAAADATSPLDCPREQLGCQATFLPPVGSATRLNRCCALPHLSAPRGGTAVGTGAAALCPCGSFLWRCQAGCGAGGLRSQAWRGRRLAAPVGTTCPHTPRESLRSAVGRMVFSYRAVCRGPCRPVLPRNPRMPA